jgi:hypothetical protein
VDSVLGVIFTTPAEVNFTCFFGPGKSIKDLRELVETKGSMQKQDEVKKLFA